MTTDGFADAGLGGTLLVPDAAVEAGLGTLDRRLRDAGLPGLSTVPERRPKPGPEPGPEHGPQSGPKPGPEPGMDPGADLGAGIAPAAETDRALLARFLRMLMPAAGDTDPLAGSALTRFGSFAGVLAAPLQELRGMNGFGTHCLSGIKLLHEAALRLARSRMEGQPVLSDPAILLDYLTAVLARERIEQFRILFLDGEHRLLSDEAQARGTVNHTPVYPREVVRRAVELEAASIVLVHNHPSGDPTPSREDVEMTKQVVAACQVMRIAVRDHLIVGNGRWTSFRDETLID